MRLDGEEPAVLAEEIAHVRDPAGLPFPADALRIHAPAGVALHAIRHRLQATLARHVPQDPRRVDAARSGILLDHHALLVRVDAGRAEDVVAGGRVQHDLQLLHLGRIEGIQCHVVEPCVALFLRWIIVVDEGKAIVELAFGRQRERFGAVPAQRP